MRINCKFSSSIVECKLFSISVGDDDLRLNIPSTPQLLKCIASKQSMVPSMSPLVQELVHDMLNALIIKCAYEEQEEMDVGPPSEVENIQEMPDSELAATPASSLFTSGPSIVVHAVPGDISSKATDKQKKEEDTKKLSADGKSIQDWQKPLLPKSSIMRLLAEIVKSYTCCAQMITMHTFSPEATNLVTEDCTVLAFILDYLLPQCQTAGDKDSPPLARVLIASLAACNHSPEAQTLLVGEIKTALARAFTLPENTEKHTKIQALTG